VRQDREHLARQRNALRRGDNLANSVHAVGQSDVVYSRPDRVLAAGRHGNAYVTAIYYHLDHPFADPEIGRGSRRVGVAEDDQRPPGTQVATDGAEAEDRL
jgi:hypothetical protein